MLTKIDHKKKEKELYKPSSKNVVAVDVPAMDFLMIDGEGNPGTAESYQQALEALYSASYTLKFMSKIDMQIDYVVLPLEGLWWADDMSVFEEQRYEQSKDEWKWTMMIRQPDHLSAEHIAEGIRRAKEKKGIATLDELRFETFEEGLCAQIMHIGPYSEEGPNIQRVHAFIDEQGKKLSGKHHEIYLSDPRRTAPEKLKTVIRQPMR